MYYVLKFHRRRPRAGGTLGRRPIDTSYPRAAAA
eukprot:SAG31_NODE_36470_length_313_cov_0.691589_1_plen_33_part_01